MSLAATLISRLSQRQIGNLKSSMKSRAAYYANGAKAAKRVGLYAAQAELMRREWRWTKMRRRLDRILDQQGRAVTKPAIRAA